MEKNITVTVKTKSGSLVTIRGDEPQDFIDRVTEATSGSFPLAVEAFEEAILRKPDAVQVVVDTLGAQVIAETPTTFQPVPPAVAPVAQQVTTKSCAHGVMTKRQGTGPYGPYKAFYCPTPQGTPDQCKPIYVKANTPEWNTF